MHSRVGRRCICVSSKQLLPCLAACIYSAHDAYAEHTKLILHVIKHPSCDLWIQTQPHHLFTSGQLQAGHQPAVSC